MLPVLALPSLASLFEASAVGGALVTGVRNLNRTSTSAGRDFFLGETIELGLEGLSSTQSVISTGLTSELSNFTAALRNSVESYQSALVPAVNSVSKGIIESSTINSGLVNTIMTSSNRTAEIGKEISNSLNSMNNIFLKLFEIKAQQTIESSAFSKIMKENLEAITLALAQLSTLPKTISESNEHSLQLLYDIHGALNFTAERTDTNTDLLSSIANSLISRNDNQALANEKIVEGITNQIATNTKIQESLDYEKTPSVAASNGNTYSPREVSAKSNAEHYIDKKGHNTMDWGAGFIDALDLDDEDDTNLLLALIEKLKTTPFEVINSFDDGRSMTKKE